MRNLYERSDRTALIRAVQQGGEAVPAAAARLGVGVSTAYRWLRVASVESPTPRPTFVEVVPDRAAAGPARLLVRVGGTEVEVRSGFDAQLLREVVEALGGEA